MAKMARDEEEQLLKQHPHLREYIEEFSSKVERPVFYSKVPRDLKENPSPNIIYPTKGVVFIHIYKTKDMDFTKYNSIEPHLTEETENKSDRIMEKILERAPFVGLVKTDQELKDQIHKFIEDFIVISDRPIDTKKGNKIRVTPTEKDAIEYDIVRKIVGAGPLECFMRDPYLEDIHIITGENVHLIHKVFGMVETNIFIDKKWANTFSQEFSEKIGSPVGEGQPIADGTMTDGSRVNIIHSKDISLKGPSMTVRKFSETPISVTQLINWGTFDAGIGAYLWLSLQYGRSLFVCGETASGKTTTANAIIPFIPPEKKIYSVENTPEVIVPHPVWQQLLTKQSGPKESHIDMDDLLKAGLRSRPDYIIPGETRGIEGRVVFQAMQTGHPVITTFHAGSVTKVIQRFTGHPINVPKTFMDNLDIVLIQMAVERKGKRLRRVLSVDEIEGYNKEADGIMSRKAFEWNSVDDSHQFKANRNSFILEERIAKNAGYKDVMKIYDEFDTRKKILQRMVEEKIFDYYEVLQIIWTYYKEGIKGLQISI
ncbi:MAG: type II/IV secretion system ATPase subunit [Candidatus Thermoplasmatota archaeon]|nr:type II/IV secretion system ATPase subunit [Candidatus Thermoplasmatota archaeon]MBU1941970.1 type II/IV secretion system ATPase subunit [Candidatus Thermoplasmatota archaeon]